MSGESAKHVVEFLGGCPISKAARLLVEAATAQGYAEGAFNGIILTASTDTRPESIVVAYDHECKERAAAYRASPEGIAAQAERERTRAEAQTKHDVLMRRLPRLNFGDQVAVLDWLCDMQGPSDHAGVIVRRDTILATFAKHDFLPGVNCDADFRPEVRDNVHRWLVGQCLDGLERLAIHHTVHKFAAEWKAKFMRTAEPVR